MKRLPFLLLFLLLLTGCAVQEQPADTTLSTAVTEPLGSSLLDVASPLYQSTGGAVSTYRIEGVAFDGLIPMGDSLLAFQNTDTTTLYLLSGTQLEIAATATLESTYASSDLLQISGSGLALYQGSGPILFLDAALNEIRSAQLPADAIGTPAVSGDLNTVYYCTTAGIHALDLFTGISRPLQQNDAASAQTLAGTLFGGQMLRHQITQPDGSIITSLVDAQTGQTVYTGDRLNDLYTSAQNYFLAVDSGSALQFVFGSYDGAPGVLWPAEAVSNCIPVPAQNALVAVYPSANACRLAYYNLTAGKYTADVTLPDISGIYSLCPGADGRIWFCTYDETTRSTGLQCWDTALSPTGDETVYTDTYYTRANPDTEGLSALETRLAELETTLGIDIILGEAAADVQPWENSFTTEYLVPVYETWLPKLEDALQQFPEGFFANTVSGQLHIILVRSIHGQLENGYTDEVSGIQYWYDTGTYIALCLTDDPTQTLYHTLGYLIDTRVLTLCNAYKDWDKLNPKGFSYDNSYTANQNRNDWQYLQEDDRSFIDMFSMSFAREDRAQIFEYAMTPGSEALFRSENMQRKLKTLCDGIRKAYGLTKDPSVFPWEQYLSN